MKIELIAKKINKIRWALGYATKEQVKEGWEGELKSIKELIRIAQEGGECSCGGFNYTKLKSGSIKITPDFSFIIKIK